MSTTHSINITIPEIGFLRQPQVLTFVPISKSTLWRRIGAGTFPAPVKLSPRVTAWRAEDLRRWIDAQGTQASSRTLEAKASLNKPPFSRMQSKTEIAS